MGDYPKNWSWNNRTMPVRRKRTARQVLKDSLELPKMVGVIIGMSLFWMLAVGLAVLVVSWLIHS